MRYLQSVATCAKVEDEDVITPTRFGAKVAEAEAYRRRETNQCFDGRARFRSRKPIRFRCTRCYIVPRYGNAVPIVKRGYGPVRARDIYLKGRNSLLIPEGGKTIYCKEAISKVGQYVES